MFIKSIKLFFATKPSTSSPVSIYIVPTLNGYPSGQALDYSSVTLNTDQVNTSSSPHYLDTTTYTEFMFQAPVYIQADTLYAVVIIGDNTPF